MKKLLIAFSFFILHSSCFTPQFCRAQNVAINNTGAAANASAMLDVSSTTGGLLPPRMTTAQMNAISNPATGLVIFNTTTNCLMFYISPAWQSIACGCTGSPATPGAISGPGAVCADTSGKIYSIAGVFGANSYTWNVPAGASITAGQGTPSITVTFGASPGNITVTATNSCGTSAASTLPVTINTVPTAVSATASPNPVCSGNTLTLTGSATGALNWSWTGPNSFSSASQSPAISNMASSGAGTYTLTASNVCGSATPVNTASIAVHTIQYVPVTITNNQSTSTGTNFQQMVTVNSSNYSSNESSGLQNVEFTTGPGATGTVLQAWIESGASNTSNNTIYWVNLGSTTISGNSTLTIYMNFMQTNVMSSSGPTGEAPQLSGTYGQSDNGTKVFSFYDNFAGSALNSMWSAIQASPSVNNGLTLNSTSNWGGISAAYSTNGNIVLEDYSSWSGQSDGIILSQTQSGNNGSYAPYGRSYSDAFNAGGSTSSQQICRADGGGAGTVLTSPSDNDPSGTYRIIGLLWLSNGTLAMYNNYNLWATTTDNTYSSMSYAGITGYSPVTYFVKWIRVRVAPPNGVVPGVSFGSQTCQ